MAEEIEWFVGIDWASQSHQVCLVDARGQLDRFRDRFTVAGAKDDRRDAHVLADSLRTDRHAFRRLSNDEPVIVKLREWSRMADDLQQERTRLASRMREQLWRYYPQMLELADDLAADWFLDLWNQAPSPAKAARLRQTTIERFVKAHRLRRWRAPEVLRILKQKPLSVAPGVVEAPVERRVVGLALYQKAFVCAVMKEIEAYGSARFLLADKGA